MTESIPLSDLETSPSAKFSKLGDSYAGRIVSIAQRQNTDLQGKPLFFDSGDPVMVLLITIEQSDGESVTLWATGGNFKPATPADKGQSMRSAIGAAAREAGASSVDVGAELAVVHTGMGAATPGKNPPRLYTAQYRKAAAASVPVDLFSNPA